MKHLLIIGITFFLVGEDLYSDNHPGLYYTPPPNWLWYNEDRFHYCTNMCSTNELGQQTCVEVCS